MAKEMLTPVRFVDGCGCAYTRCLGGGFITASDEAIVVTTPTKQLKRVGASNYVRLEVNWPDRVQTVFHRACWTRLMSAPDMPGSARKILEAVAEMMEVYDTVESIHDKANRLAALLRDSKKTVVFTGAGISASSGISTYRGTDGIDTLASFGETRAPPIGDELYDAEGNLRYEKLRPTVAHQAIADFVAGGLVSYVITQNCDDLHAKSSVPRASLSELHGNVFVEYCESCNTEYVRDYAVDAYSTDCRNEAWYVKCPTCHFNHYTGRRCRRKGCKGKLKDTIVNFGDDLHDVVLGGFPKAEKECGEADLVVVVGSSMTVTPASTLPRLAKQFVFINLQELEDDSGCTLQIHGPSDMVFQAVKSRLCTST